MNVMIFGRSDCCGCGLCSVICPKMAIIMTCDDRGFLHPAVNEQKCVQCELCISTCVFNKRKEKIRNKAENNNAK